MPYPSPMPEYQPLFHQVQNFIADQLNSDPQLSGIGIEFLPESQLDIEYGIKRNLGRQGMVGIVNTLKGQYGGHDQDSCAWEIESEIDVLETPTVRRAWLKKNDLSAGTTVDVLNYIQESLCGPASPTYGKFCPVTQEIGEDNGVVVGKAVVKTFAIADVSACVSGESNWHIRYATEADISALWQAVDDLSAELSGSEEVWNAIEELSSDVSSISRNVSNLTDQVDSVEQQIENLDDLAVKYTDDDKYLVVLNPRPNWTTSLRINDGSAIGNSQIQFGSGQGSYRNYITRNRMVLGLPEDNETPEDVGDTQIQFGGVHNDADLILGAGIHIISSTEKGKSQILMDDQRLYVVTPAEVSAGQTLKAVQVYDDPTLNTMSFRGSANQAGMKSREEPKWHWEYHSANLPDKTSDLTNDSGYVTSSEVSAEISSVSQDIQDLSSEVISAYEEIPSIWRVWEYTPGWVRFTARTSNVEVFMNTVGVSPVTVLEYTVDNGQSWHDFIPGNTSVILARNGDSMCLRAKTTNTATAFNGSNYLNMGATGRHDISGNLAYILDPDGTVGTLSQWAFHGLFWGDDELMESSGLVLPWTTVPDHGYQFMFPLCTRLRSAPKLPATTVGERAYANMFESCTNLWTAPEISATTLGASCFNRMFYDSAIGVAPSVLPVKTLSTACYSGMFEGCYNLTSAPRLSATTLASACYKNMFKGCSKLSEIKLDYTGNFSAGSFLTNPFDTWVNGVSASGTFYYNGSDTTRGNSAIPANWTIQTF